MPALPLRRQPEPAPAPAPRQGTRCRRCVRFGIAGVVDLAALCAACSVYAQLSGSVSVVSDYRYRGITLSDNEPAAQLGLTYDAAQGWYAGAFVSTAESSYYQTQGVQAIGFGGYASRLPSGVTVEIGADYSVVTTAPRFDYPEVYAGFVFQNVSGRVYYSPRYFGQDSPAVYGELNLAQPLHDKVHLVAHVGFLGSHAKPGYGPSSGTVVDAAAGVSVLWEGFAFQVTWVGINHASAAYALTGTGNRNGVVASLSHGF